MRSTGEVMGIDEDFGLAFAKSQLAAGQIVPLSWRRGLQRQEADKPQAVTLAQGIRPRAFSSMPPAALRGVFRENGLTVTEVYKVREGGPISSTTSRAEIHLLVNTPEGRYTPADSYSIRRAALEYNIPYTTTVAAARATLDAIRAMKRGKLEVKPPGVSSDDHQAEESRRSIGK
jgi:carbamoyl-phosphate synthase large subunit